VDNQVEENLAVQQGQESGNMEKRDADPSEATPIVDDPPRMFIHKAPYPERL
jgi:hypothetical protein